MKLAAFFRLIRWKNLLLLIYLQILLKFSLFSSFELITNLSVFQFVTLLFSLILITAAGYIINEPQKVIVNNYFSVESLQHLYLIVNTLGIVSGIGLSLSMQKPTYSFIFIGASLLLYFYSKTLKSKPLIGNIAVSFLVAFSIITLCLFDLDFAIQSIDQQLVIYVIMLLSIFAFLINMVREVVKDIEDINGDYSLKMNTLPIRRCENKKNSFVSMCFPFGFVVVYCGKICCNIQIHHNIFVAVYIDSVALYCYKIALSKNKKRF